MTDKARIYRKRIAVETRLKIVDAVMNGQLNGADAARAYAVSEATVHRLIKAERLAHPERIMLCRDQMKSDALDAYKEIEHVSDSDHKQRSSRRALTVDQEEEVVERFYSGSDIASDLAREFAVHKSSISRILHTARVRDPSRQLPEQNRAEWQRRVNDGVTRAMAVGRHPGAKSRLPDAIREAVLIEFAVPGTSYASIARKYGLSPSRVGRIVSHHRVNVGPDNPQSLEEILSELIGE